MSDLRDLMIDRFVLPALSPRAGHPITPICGWCESRAACSSRHISTSAQAAGHCDPSQRLPCSAGTSRLEPATAEGGFAELCKVPVTPNTAFVQPRTEKPGAAWPHSGWRHRAPRCISTFSAVTGWRAWWVSAAKPCQEASVSGPRAAEIATPADPERNRIRA